MHSYSLDGKILIRFIAFTTGQLNGNLRINDTLQVRPLPDDVPKPKRSLANSNQYPFLIEYVFDKIDLDTLRKIRTKGLAPGSAQPTDSDLQTDFCVSKKQEIISVLSVLLQNSVYIEVPAPNWVREDNDEQQPGNFSSSQSFFAGYSRLGESLSTYDGPEIPPVDTNDFYNLTHYSDTRFDVSTATSSLLETYFGLGNEEKEAFLSACVLFTKSLNARTIARSLTYIGMVSSLEALIEFEHRGAIKRHCGECHQPMYKVVRKFLDFIATYASPSSDTLKYAKRLYGRRSGIGHLGRLLAEDIVGQVVPPSDEARDYSELYNMSRIVRICFANWLETRAQPAPEVKVRIPVVWGWLDALGRKIEGMGNKIQDHAWRRIGARGNN